MSLCVTGWVAHDVVNCHNELIFRPKQSKCLTLKINSLRSFETSWTTRCTTRHIQKELKLQMPVTFVPIWDYNIVFSYWQVNCSTAQYVVTMSSFRHMLKIIKVGFQDISVSSLLFGVLCYCFVLQQKKKKKNNTKGYVVTVNNFVQWLTAKRTC
jgi:hypothetical protein